MAEIDAALCAPFDGAAPGYDAQFSATPIGRHLREMVWRQLTPLLRPGMTVLDLGCGTGEDALWLARQDCQVVAADSSAAMLHQVERKSALAGLAARVTTCRIDLNAAQQPELGRHFDLIVSNFGALNCVADMPALGRNLGHWLRPGGVAALTVMGRFCAWEFLWYLAHWRAAALRRLIGRTGARIGGVKLTVFYWSVGALLKALGPGFQLQSATAIGVLLPPSYLFHVLDGRPRLLGRLARWDRSLAGNPVCARLADHTLVLFRRVDP